ncbi:low-affinity Zn(2+) transporter zrt2, partial [Coemansia sp. RSA 2603]
MAAAALSGNAPNQFAGSVPANEHVGETVGAEDDQDSTAIISQQSSLAKQHGLPADVKRQALATYFLEIGIALYSVLIGLALAISDHGFLALFIAICFHQFFEGLALGTSLAELYWIKTQIAAHRYELDAAEGGTLASDEQANPDSAPLPVQQSDTNRSALVVPNASAQRRNIQSTGSVNFEKDMHVIDPAGFVTEPQYQTQHQKPRSMSTNEALNSDDFEYHSTDKGHRQSKSRRTLTSMATSFTPEPWQVNPQLEVSLGNISQGYVIVGQPPDLDIGASSAAISTKNVKDIPSHPRYLQPRTEPERLPG